jgi:hypothetical protein
MDAEVIGLVTTLETLSAEVVQTREQRTELLTESKEVCRKHE